MGKRRWLKRIVLLFALVLVALVAAAVLYPFWLPYAARPFAGRFGAHFGSYTRLENGRFALRDLEYTNRAVTVRAAKVEGFLPHVWYRNRNQTNSERAFLEVDGWKVLLHAAGQTNAGPRTNRSVFGDFKKFERWVSLGREWLPKAQLLNGTVVAKGREFTFGQVTIENGQLEANGVWPENAIPLEIKGKLAGEPYQISYAMHPLDLRVRLQMFETNSGFAAKIAGFYKGNRLDATAEFGPESGMLPRVASLRAEEVKLPAQLVKLQGYSDLGGSLSGRWFSNHYTITLSAHAEPTGEGTRPVLDLNVEASGDTNRARVEKLNATMPGLKLALSEPVEINYSGRMLSGQSELAIDAELGKLPWGNLEGQMNATVLLKPGEKIPVFWVKARGTNLNAARVRMDWLKASARIEWPRVEDLMLDGQIGSNATVTLTGGADLRSRSLTDVKVTVEGSVGTNGLPNGVGFESVKFAANASGALTNLRHAGALELRRFSAPGVEPLNLEAAWQGTMFAFKQLAVRLRAGPAMLRAEGEGFFDERGTNFTFRELTLSKGDEAYLTLAKPFTVRITEGPRIETGELEMTGRERELRLSGAVRWPSEGDLNFAARNVSPELLQSFVTRSLRGVDVPALRLAARWSNGPVNGSALGVVGLEEKRFGRLRARLDAEMNDSGLMLTNLSVADAGGEVVRAVGFLPLILNPVATNGMVKLSRREEMDFRLQTEPSEHFWGVVGDLTKLDLSNPVARLELRGTVRNPAGELEVQAGHIALRRTNRELPSIGPVFAKVALNEQVLKIAQLEAYIDEQKVAVSGRVQLETNFWTQRREQAVEYLLDHADLRLDAPDVALGPFARFAPQFMAAQGRASIDARLLPGRKLAGTITVREVETRPISKIGVVQNIRADLRLNGREIEVQDLAGVIGGQRLGITGKIDVSDEFLTQGYPKIDLAIRGENVPLARNPDVILRSDLNLSVKNGTNMVPVIAGDVTLRDSFLLRDIATLVPGRVAGPERRPPYFTVPQDPVDDWPLNVRVRGENFMRIRSPFFQGVASANFSISGTMEEPMALGEAAISSGRVIFPFASLEVKQALVSLSSENPYLPHVFVTAAGRAFGFDVRMEVEGFADQPVIEFSSVPALTSEQIILMLTTGQIPREDFGFSQQDRAGKLAVFLGKSLWEKLNPGKAGEERLSIRSGQDITEQGRQTYEVEYKLSDRWSLVGEYDRFGALNANVKWRVFSR